MKFQKNKLGNCLLVASISIAIITGCKKDDNVPENPPANNESELITTLKLVFSDSAGVQPDRYFVFSDPDGDGGNAPSVFDTIRLAAFTSYHVEILLLDESKSPIDTISNEILAEAEDHLFFFFHNGSIISTSYSDSDANSFGVGLRTKWVTGQISNGTSRVVLKHQPGTKDGTFGPGETDVDITFVSAVL